MSVAELGVHKWHVDNVLRAENDGVDTRHMTLDPDMTQSQADLAAYLVMAGAGKVMKPRRYLPTQPRPNNKTCIAAEIDAMAEIVCVFPDDEQPVLCHSSKCRKILGACL